MPTIENDNSKESKGIDYPAKHDMGKPKISLVPPQILIDIAEEWVRFCTKDASVLWQNRRD